MKTRTCSRLLIIGAYGTFGGRLVGLLGDNPGLTLLIAGRSLHKATQFVERNPGPATMVPVAFDRDEEVAAQIAALHPDIVVDASGPWQAYGERPYRVAEAAISIGAHYLDLADGTDFVCAIATLDAAAKDKGVFALAGTSTCPVLTMAVARSLSRDLAHVESISGGIAPSPFAGMGKSVIQAIAGYAGKPVQVYRDRKLKWEHTFTSTRQFTIAPPGILPLPPMRFSLIDVPDLRLLGELNNPVCSTWFGVSTTPFVYHWFLRLLARAVKGGFLPTLRPLAGIMHFVSNHLSWGAHRGGMFIEVRGTDMHGAKMRRSWHLLAEGDNGPAVPALAATAIIRQCVAGQFPPPGARPAADALALEDYLPMFGELNIQIGERVERHADEGPIFRNILGNAWDSLPSPIRKLHDRSSTSLFEGRASVRQGNGVLAKIVGRFAGFPKPGIDIPVTVRISKEGDSETWTRDFSGHVFSSELSIGRGRFSALLCEQFGPCRFGMALVTEGEVLRYVSRRWTFLGLPMPKWMMPNGNVFESVIGGKFVFHVELRLPIIGHVVTYEGWLTERD